MKPITAGRISVEIVNKEVVVFSLTARVSYIGELVSDVEDKITLKKALLIERAQNPKTGEEMVHIGPVPYASRESNITISKKISAGILLDQPDADLKSHYEKEVIAAYSKLKLA
jgi:hypothetical protein